MKPYSEHNKKLLRVVYACNPAYLSIKHDYEWNYFFDLFTEPDDCCKTTIMIAQGISIEEMEDYFKIIFEYITDNNKNRYCIYMKKPYDGSFSVKIKNDFLNIAVQSKLLEGEFKRLGEAFEKVKPHMDKKHKILDQNSFINNKFKKKAGWGRK